MENNIINIDHDFINIENFYKQQERDIKTKMQRKHI